jgi:ParB-like chromosome segregation protein Spo0J
MADLQDIPLDQLHPHPDNPRIGLRVDVVDRLAVKMKTAGFGQEHAILARPYGDGWQIISGHHRAEAAKRAGLTEAPTWIREMDDYEAFMLLVLCNNQGELTPLEIGMHALKAVTLSEGGRGKKGGLSEYAEQLGFDKSYTSKLRDAARVADSVDSGQRYQVADKAKHLYEISRALPETWPVLVESLVKRGWTVADAQHHVQQIKAFDIPAEWAFWLPCDLAGVEPWFEDYKGEDPDGYALAVNIHRRNLSKGQIAMVAAQALLKNSSQSKVATSVNVSQQYIGHARVVLDFAPELAAAVAAGAMPLNEAYRTARDNKDAADSDETKKAELRELAPDLAVLVENGVRQLGDALKEAKLRAIVHEIDDARNADGAPAPTFAERAESGSITWDEAATLAQQWRTERAEAIKRAQNSAIQLVNHWGVIQTIRDHAATPYVADILAGLGDSDRAAIDRITTELKGWRAVHGGRGGGAPSAHPGRRGASGEGAAAAGWRESD